ncbi:unnamed protein product, partial [Allacma fusca]
YRSLFSNIYSAVIEECVQLVCPSLVRYNYEI